MKKILFFIVICMQSCISVVPLHNKYDPSPIAGVFNSPYDKVWQSVIDVVVYNNLPVNVIEKESGLISSYQSSYRAETTYEANKDKKPIHPEQLIITHRPNSNEDSQLRKRPASAYSASFPFDQLTGRWKIAVKKISDNKTEVLVTLGGFEFIPSKTFINIPYIPQIYSLGNFERNFLNDVKDRLD